MLEIKYLGHSCFLVHSKDGLRVLTDPYGGASGYVLPRTEADIVLISHNHVMHNCLESVDGQPAVIQGEGYRELNWVKIRGIPAYHDAVRGAERGLNTIFCWDMRAIRFCHLGDLGHKLDTDLLAQIGPVDVLFFPIGGGSVLDIEAASEMIAKIPHKYAIPMHYRTQYNSYPKYTLEEFITGQKDIIIPEPRNILKLKRQDFEDVQKIVSMEYLA